MRKFLVVLFAGLLMIGVLAGISAAQEKVKLTMYAYADMGTVEGQQFMEFIEIFKTSHPNIEFEIEALGGEGYHNKLQAMAAAGQLPDIVYLWPGKRTGIVTDKGLIKDLRPWLKGKEDQFVPFALAPQGANGEIFELPFAITSTHEIYANNKLLKDLGFSYPKTLDEMVQQAKKIKEAGLVSIAIGNKEGWPMQSCFFSTLVERAGGMEWYKNAIKGNGASFKDPQFVSALNVLKTLTDGEVFAPGINQLERSQATELFMQGKAVYYIEGSWNVQEFQKTFTPEMKEYVTIEAFPAIPDQKGQANSHSAVPGTGFGMNAKLEGAKADAAWEWIWFWAGPEGSSRRIKNGTIPGYKVEVPADLDPMMKKLVTYVNTNPMGYVLDNELDAEGINLLQVGLQELTMGSKTPEQVAEEYENWVAANDSNRKK